MAGNQRKVLDPQFEEERYPSLEAWIEAAEKLIDAGYDPELFTPPDYLVEPQS